MKSHRSFVYSGKRESDWESLHVKPIYFPKQGSWGSWEYKLAFGAELRKEHQIEPSEDCVTCHR